MKNLVRLSVVVAAFAMASFTVLPVEKNVENVKKMGASISWKADVIDMGEIPQGTPKSIDFEFTNNSSKVVLITNVQGSCGCTATNYTKTAIEPGKKGSVTATYNAANKGAFTKTVTVTTNAEETPKVLTFKGTVL
jgi:hypothetical protein